MRSCCLARSRASRSRCAARRNESARPRTEAKEKNGAGWSGLHAPWAVRGRRLRQALEQRVHGGFEAIFPFDGARCRDMAERVVAGLQALGKL